MTCLYTIYTGLGAHPNRAANATVELLGFALGLGLPGATAHDGYGAWKSPEGEIVVEPVNVFTVVTKAPTDDLPWDIRLFANEIKSVFAQKTVLVVATPAHEWAL